MESSRHAQQNYESILPQIHLNYLKINMSQIL